MQELIIYALTILIFGAIGYNMGDFEIKREYRIANGGLTTCLGLIMTSVMLMCVNGV